MKLFKAARISDLYAPYENFRIKVLDTLSFINEFYVKYNVKI